MELHIDLMELADIGNPERIAEAIIQQNPNIPLPIPVEDIAHHCGIREIERKNDIPFEGTLVADAAKSEGIIVCSANSHPQRQRFTIAHELGHFLIPTHKNEFRYTCTNKMISFSVTNSFINKEQEANVFASRLLLPRKLLEREVKKLEYIDFEGIDILSKLFLTSREALIRTLVNYVDEPIAFLFSKNNILTSFCKSLSFPYLAISPKQKLFSTIELKKTKGITPFEDEEASYWINSYKNIELCKQNYVFNDGYAITLLSIENSDKSY